MTSHDDLDRVVDYARSQGIQVDLVGAVPRRFASVDVVNRCGVVGEAWKEGRVMLYMRNDADDNHCAAMLAHELGHCEQDRVFYDEEYGLRHLITWSIEFDAWERGLRILGELGITVSPESAASARDCLLTYWNPFLSAVGGCRQTLDTLESMS